MALIAPFRGLRYNPAKVEKLEAVVTPPYDVIDQQRQAELLARHPYNMIQLDLSKGGGQAAGEERYRQARALLQQWQAEQVLIRDAVPAVYLYHIEYTHPAGRPLTRKGLVALVRLSEFSEGVVKPHEKTFRGVVTDRLRLLDTCRTQFSQIFSLYEDRENLVMARLEAACSGGPLYRVRDQDNGLHQLRPVTDPQALAEVREFLAERPFYIADGHHRYTTALQMRELMRERHGELPPDSPFNYTMMYLCSMEDPGLSVLPTHRLVRLEAGSSLAGLAEAMAPAFEIREITGGSRETLAAQVLAAMEEAGAGNTRLGLYHPGEDRALLLTLKPEAPARLLGEVPAPLRELDVVVLSDLVLDRLLKLDHERCEQEGRLEYFSDPDEILDVAVKEAVARQDATPAVFLMNPTAVGQVKRVADEGLVMPHKSTFFYPKILTGLVFNPMEEGERVAVPGGCRTA